MMLLFLIKKGKQALSIQFTNEWNNGGKKFSPNTLATSYTSAPTKGGDSEVYKATLSYHIQKQLNPIPHNKSIEFEVIIS